MENNNFIVQLFQKEYNKISDWENLDVNKKLLDEVIDFLQYCVSDFDNE